MLHTFSHQGKDVCGNCWGDIKSLFSFDKLPIHCSLHWDGLRDRKVNVAGVNSSLLQPMVTTMLENSFNTQQLPLYVGSKHKPVVHTIHSSPRHQDIARGAHHRSDTTLLEPSNAPATGKPSERQAKPVGLCWGHRLFRSGAQKCHQHWIFVELGNHSQCVGLHKLSEIEKYHTAFTSNLLNCFQPRSGSTSWWSFDCYSLILR